MALPLDLYDLRVADGAGYSATGGPWVTPEMSMKQLVWTETRVNANGSEFVLDLMRMGFFPAAAFITG